MRPQGRPKMGYWLFLPPFGMEGGVSRVGLAKLGQDCVRAWRHQNTAPSALP